jgi:hypothetical protein
VKKKEYVVYKDYLDLTNYWIYINYEAQIFQSFEFSFKKETCWAQYSPEQ